MSSNCAGCGKFISGQNQFMECSNCANNYDLLCLKIPKEKFAAFSQAFKDKWLCPSCKCSLPKGNNSSTPARSQLLELNDGHGNENVHSYRGTRSQGTKTKSSKTEQVASSELSSLIAELRQLRQEVTEVKKQNSEIKDQMSVISESLSQNLKDCTRKLQNAENEIVNLKSTVGHLQLQLAAREQEQLSNDLEIVGLAEQNNESLQHIIIAASKKLGVQLTETDIDDVFRTGSKISKLRSTSTTIMPRPIVVRLLRRRKAEELVKAAKSRRNVTSENIVQGQPAPFYINERLTRENRQLFRDARKRSKDFGFQYCWVKRGAIYVRKADGKPAMRISNSLELDEKVGIAEQIDSCPAAPLPGFSN